MNWLFRPTPLRYVGRNGAALPRAGAPKDRTVLHDRLSFAAEPTAADRRVDPLCYPPIKVASVDARYTVDRRLTLLDGGVGSKAGPRARQSGAVTRLQANYETPHFHSLVDAFGYTRNTINFTSDALNNSGDLLNSYRI